MTKLLLTLLFLTFSLQAENKVKYIDNGFIKLGVDLNKGGSITYISDSKASKNLINNFDLGRQIQMAFYSGPIPYEAEGQKPKDHWKHIGWNPIQTGDDFDNHSKILETNITKESIYVKCVPVQWPLNNIKGDCFFETWITLRKNVVHFKGKLTNKRKDKKQYRARHQELPAVYVNSDYFNLVTYKGNKPFSGDKLFFNPEPLKPKQHWHYWTATENWAAYVNDENYGLGVYRPNNFHFSGGFAGRPKTGGTKANSTAYIAPISTEIIDHNISFDYQTYFILGSIKEIRDFVYKNKPSKFNEWTFTNSRESWSAIGLTDSGWPIKGHLSTTFKGNAGAYFVSPLTFAKSKSYKSLIVEMKHTGKASSFFVAFKSNDKSTKPFTVKIKEKNKACIYTIDLSKIPNLPEVIEKIRIHPFSGDAGKEDQVEIHSVKFK